MISMSGIQITFRCSNINVSVGRPDNCGSGNMSRGGNDCRIYVGNLPPDIRSKEIEDIFYRFGTVLYVDLKNRRGPPFAFVEFEDPRDAEEAVDRRDGYDYDGYRLRVEFPRGGSRGRFAGGDRYRERGRSSAPARRSEYRVVISGLPKTASWQDVKDHMREAGDVCFADVYKDGTGIVEFLRYDDMKYAVRKLDDTKLRSHEGDSAYIRVVEDRANSPSRGYRSRSYSRSRSRSRSYSYSPRRRSSRSLSRSYSRSPS